MSACASCGKEIPPGRAFCPSCGAEASPAVAARPTGARYSDVQTVDLAAVPAGMRAPTTWTIAKGVLLGLIMFSVLSAVVSALAFGVLLSLGD